MWGEVNENIQEQDTEQEVISRVHELKEQNGTINEHIDHVMEDAPTKLKVTVNVSDADWQKMHGLFDQEHKWMLAKMQEHIREVNGMFA